MNKYEIQVDDEKTPCFLLVSLFCHIASWLGIDEMKLTS